MAHLNCRMTAPSRPSVRRHICRAPAPQATPPLASNRTPLLANGPALFWRSYDLLRVRDRFAIYFRAHDRRESGLAAGEPSQDIHQLRDLRWRIEVHHHERLAPRRIAIKGLWTEPLDHFGKHGTGPLSRIDGVGSRH